MSADEHPTQPLPDPSAQWVLSTDAAAPAPRRHRRWPWLVAVLAVVGLAVGAWLAGEYIARGIVERTIRDQLVQHLDLPADQQIDIDIPGAIVPQLIVGSLAEVRISSDDVPLDGVTADVSVNAQDVPIRGGDWSGAHATVALDQAQLQALLAGIDGFPAQTVGLQAPDVTAAFELRLFALTVPVGVSLTPSTADGELVLSPASLRVGGAEITAEGLRDQFGSVASTVLQDWRICIADRLPAAVHLTDVAVEGDHVTANLEIDASILSDGAAQQKGTCA